MQSRSSGPRPSYVGIGPASAGTGVGNPVLLEVDRKSTWNCDAGLSDLKAELEQLAMDARRSPQRIVNAHPPDQRAQIRANLRSTSMSARFPAPVPTEAGPMPAHKGLRADDRDGLEDRRKPSIQHN